MTAPDYGAWRRFGEASILACKAHGGDPASLTIAPPASAEDVAAVEAALDLTLPPAFRRVLTEFSASFELMWFLPSGSTPPFSGIFSGGLAWSLDALAELEESRLDWIRNVFSNEDDAYDRVWRDKLAIHDVGNGDLLALDLVAPGNPLVYLSHDGGEGHGYVLGNDFCDALNRWIQLGCVGPEDWQWLPFVGDRASNIAPDGEAARVWRAWFGIDRHLG